MPVYTVQFDHDSKNPTFEGDQALGLYQSGISTMTVDINTQDAYKYAADVGTLQSAEIVNDPAYPSELSTETVNMYSLQMHTKPQADDKALESAGSVNNPAFPTELITETVDMFSQQMPAESQTDDRALEAVASVNSSAFPTKLITETVDMYSQQMHTKPQADMNTLEAASLINDPAHPAELNTKTALTSLNSAMTESTTAGEERTVSALQQAGLFVHRAQVASEETETVTDHSTLDI